MPHPAFEDRTVTLDAPDQLALLGTVLGSRTRIEVLRILVRSSKPLNINEVARRVGVDASPVRSHLELLVKAGFAREVTPATGRERLFQTPLENVHLRLEGINRADAPDPAATAVPKPVVRLQRKLEGLGQEMERLEAKARKLQTDLQAAWRETSSAPRKNPTG